MKEYKEGKEMKIALELKEERKQEIIDRLNKKKYMVDTNSFGCIWVYGLKNIHNPYAHNALVLENGNLTTGSIEIMLEDINYFEIHLDEAK